MDQTTLELFGRTPREVGNPQRYPIYNLKQLQKFKDNNNGISNCYVSLYPSNYLIDKVFFDFDYGLTVLEDTKAVFRYLTDQGDKVIPVVSGKKGYHLYWLLKPHIYGPDVKVLLTKATYRIIHEVFGEFTQQSVIGDDGKQRQIFRTKDRIIAIDPACAGDISRLVRIPNTLRPPQNTSYCTYLPPDNFLDMTESEILHHHKSQHHYRFDTDRTGCPLLTDFEYDLDTNFKEHQQWQTLSKPITTSNPNIFLKNILRPCIYNRITIQHPTHLIRVIATIDLLNMGFNPESILDVYSTLGWEDFDKHTTQKHILHCRKYKPYSCTKLRQLGIPTQCCVG